MRQGLREHTGEAKALGSCRGGKQFPPSGPQEASGEKQCNQRHVRTAGGVDFGFNSFIIEDAPSTSFI